MPSTIVTSKGRVTIPKAIRDLLHIGAGDQIDFVVTERGDVLVRSASLDVRELRGLLKRPRRHSVSVEEMNEAIVRQAGRMRGRIRMAHNFDAPSATFSIRRSEVQFGSLVCVKDDQR
ncbi:MAG TPA: AbrB/MazE/SpoVT family DNA-binding domain-containing protein [Thermoanaerobaculia bacterium]